VAFLGRHPHRIDDRGSQLLKSLKDIGFEQFLLAEQQGWVLYVEGATDLSILKAWAEVLAHPASALLDKVFVRYVGNRISRAREHFNGLREAKDDLIGLAVIDRDQVSLKSGWPMMEVMWRRREIESYLCTQEVLERWAREAAAELGPGGLFAQDWQETMRQSIAAVSEALRTLGKGSPWGPDLKVSDEFLTPVFDQFFERIALRNLMGKTDYHRLAKLMRADEIDPEVVAVLDLVVDAGDRAVRPDNG
jgi:hypothetical protein